MTLARQRTTWAAHLYVHLAVLSLGVALLYLALSARTASETGHRDGRDLEATDDERRPAQAAPEPGGADATRRPDPRS